MGTKGKVKEEKEEREEKVKGKKGREGEGSRKRRKGKREARRKRQGESATGPERGAGGGEEKGSSARFKAGKGVQVRRE